MQTKPVPTEGQDSAKQETESALRDAACCASSFDTVRGIISSMMSDFPWSVDVAEGLQLIRRNSVVLANGSKHRLHSDFGKHVAIRSSKHGQDLDRLRIQRTVPLLELLWGLGELLQLRKQGVDKRGRRALALKGGPKKFSLTRWIAHIFLHNVDVLLREQLKGNWIEIGVLMAR